MAKSFLLVIGAVLGFGLEALKNFAELGQSRAIDSRIQAGLRLILLHYEIELIQILRKDLQEVLVVEELGVMISSSALP